MSRILNTIIFVFVGLSAFSQNSLDHFLTEIESNNYSLKAYLAYANAEKLDNRTGLNPSNPTIEGAYLWGAPETIGNRQDFSVTQEIEFPTVYINQQKLADIRDEQSDSEYRQQRLGILQQAAILWVDMVSLNRKQMEMKNRLSSARKLDLAYNEMLIVGDANLIDRNKAALFLLQYEKELESLAKEKQQVLLQISALNGNLEFNLDETEFLPIQLPENLGLWMEQMAIINPQLQYLNLEQQAGERSVKIAKGKSLPKLNGGYMVENTGGEKFRGVTIGLSVPLWEQRNTIRAKQARNEAVEMQEQAYQLQLKNQLTQIYTQVENSQNLVVSYRDKLKLIQQKELLDEALELGQISLIEYLMELQFNYDAIDLLMEAEQQLHQTYVSMKVLEL